MIMTNAKFAEVSNPITMTQAAESIILQGPRPVSTMVTHQQPPSGYKIDHRFVETKSQRVQLLMQPSKVAAMKKYAQEHGISNNEVVNQALSKFLNLDE